ncbi:restriction modification system DNA specificity domain-containing protein [Shewanella hafniensis]|uniref:restriction endonuclease subunit S n=1 Tax=Shewanella hafniensis TaxID=365590 RepID=UPI001BB9D4AA|nr:restriction endonuclease subunit S [Shewanella hafniensis]MCL1136688.1 restriction endonuclease subunit S [Shewanella hafniensis]GIU36293.1 restriction modification system DNA specificity domain-containing protein [Shewanella hafniensis]
MARYQKYDLLKESGQRWLGLIPQHWNTSYSKWLFKERNVKAEISNEMLTASQKYGVIPQKLFMELEQQKVVQVQTGHDILKQVKNNDFVISMRSFQGGIEYCGYSGAISSAYVPLEPQENISLGYYKYLFKSKQYIQALQSTTNLVRDGQALRYSNFLQVRLPVLPVDEADKIAAFLDYETVRIDQLIAKQQRLIELLKEKRQAVISHAVTKGLNPNAPMKDSGVEWLGQVPDHWECSRVGWLCDVGNGMTPNRNNTEYWNEGHIPWLNSSKVNDGEVYFAEQFVTETAFAECSLPWVKSNSVIMAITGEGKTRGTTAITRIDTTINQHVAYMMPMSECIVPDFLCMWLQSQYGRIRFESEGWGSTKAAITCSDIKAYPIPLPSVPEQIDIVERLKASNTKFDNLMLYASKQVDLLQERRTALISAAVTGKIDLRDWTPPKEG